MRFVCLHRPGTAEGSRVLTPEQIERLSDLLYEMGMAGALLAVEGMLESVHGVRVRRRQGEVSAVDGPFKDVEQLVSSVLFIRAKTKADAVAWAKKLLEVLGDGELELRLIRAQTAQRVESLA
ncbi:MAG TPA: hypothetical protein VJR89_06260 [Polyangiales bacterium]|nr:hypothetical protein [Polyangiales bacterium]